MALDREDLVHLPDEHKDRLRALESLFESDGWKWIKAWAVANADERLGRLIGASSWEQNRTEFGARFAYLHMLNIEAETEAAYQQLIDEIKEKKQEQEEEGNE